VSRETRGRTPAFQRGRLQQSAKREGKYSRFEVLHAARPSPCETISNDIFRCCRFAVPEAFRDHSVIRPGGESDNEEMDTTKLLESSPRSHLAFYQAIYPQDQDCAYDRHNEPGRLTLLVPSDQLPQVCRADRSCDPNCHSDENTARIFARHEQLRNRTHNQSDQCLPRKSQNRLVLPDLYCFWGPIGMLLKKEVRLPGSTQSAENLKLLSAVPRPWREQSSVGCWA
jgi:hypothetical protein